MRLRIRMQLIRRHRRQPQRIQRTHRIITSKRIRITRPTSTHHRIQRIHRQKPTRTPVKHPSPHPLQTTQTQSPTGRQTNSRTLTQKTSNISTHHRNRPRIRNLRHTSRLPPRNRPRIPHSHTSNRSHHRHLANTSQCRHHRRRIPTQPRAIHPTRLTRHINPHIHRRNQKLCLSKIRTWIYYIRSEIYLGTLFNQYCQIMTIARLLSIPFDLFQHSYSLDCYHEFRTVILMLHRKFWPSAFNRPSRSLAALPCSIHSNCLRSLENLSLFPEIRRVAWI